MKGLKLSAMCKNKTPFLRTWLQSRWRGCLVGLGTGGRERQGAGKEYETKVLSQIGCVLVHTFLSPTVFFSFSTNGNMGTRLHRLI